SPRSGVGQVGPTCGRGADCRPLARAGPMRRHEAAAPTGDNRAMTGPCNIAAALPRLAAEAPDRIAMRCPGRSGRYDVALTYGELDRRSDAIAAGLAAHGVVRGSRTVVMVRPTPEFFLLMFALFKAGA